MRRLLGVGAAVLFIFAATAGVANASGPAASLNQTSLDFGVQNSQNDVGITLDVDVSSTGDSNLEIESVSVFQLADGPFDAYPQAGCNQPLAPGGKCRINVGFNYWSAPPGAWDGILSIQTNASDQPLEVSLTGEIRRTTVEITEPAFDFGSAPLGLTSGGKSHTFTVKSTGSVPFAPGAYVAGPDASSFAVTGNECTVMVEPGESCDVTVTFRPRGDSPGNRTAWLFAGGGMLPQSTDLSGRATVQRPARVGFRVEAPRRAIAGRVLRIPVHASNGGGFDSAPISVQATGPRKLTAGNGSKASIPALGPGASVNRVTTLKIRRAAAGRTVTIRLIARQGGQKIWSTTRKVRIVDAG